MRTLIVTSEITFVPHNYDRFVCAMASHPSVVGLLVIKNKNRTLWLSALALIITLAAPRLGWHLMSQSSARRRKSFSDKLYFEVESINSSESIELIKSYNIDLVVNARTRSIFKSEILSAPRIGCVNIHHGLLPNQRGLMCDLWSLANRTSFGFSIHQMTAKIDDGSILRKQEVPDGGSRSYLQNILAASVLESQVCSQLIDEVKETRVLAGIENKAESAIYRKNPGLFDFYRFRFKGVRL
jgi:methionyl-tRNA formyltransferase